MSNPTFVDVVWDTAKAYGEKVLRHDDAVDDNLLAQWNQMCADRSLWSAQDLVYRFKDAGVDGKALHNLVGALKNYYDAIEQLIGLANADMVYDPFDVILEKIFNSRSTADLYLQCLIMNVGKE